MYIIKYHYEATEKNTNFAGDIHDAYTGKGGNVLSIRRFPNECQIEFFGYPTLAGAKRGLRCAQENAEWETKNGWWNVTAELVKC